MPTSNPMKQLAILALCTTLATPTLAQENEPLVEGLDLLGQGSRLLLEGLRGELGPLFDDMEALSSDLAPFLQSLNEQLSEGLGELNAYHPPEILPNGDIIIRRKTPDERPPEAPIDL